MFQSQSHTLIVKRSSLLCLFTNFCYHSCFPMPCEPPSNWTHTLTAVPMAVAITTTLNQWWGVWTELSRLTSTFQAVLPMQRHWCMPFSSLGRGSGGHAPSKCGIESNSVALELCHMLFLSPPWNSHCKSSVLIFMIANFNEYICVANLIISEFEPESKVWNLSLGTVDNVNRKSCPCILHQEIMCGLGAVMQKWNQEKWTPGIFFPCKIDLPCQNCSAGQGNEQCYNEWCDSRR